MVGLRKHYESDIKSCLSPKKSAQNDDEIDYGDDDGLDLSLDKMKRVFNKHDSKNMEIIGQFNKGFIIAKLENDIFIIDQHATDEKHRFENLMKNCKMKSQPLLVPKQINCITPQQEIAITENLDIFESNGFKFSVDENKENGNRLRITSLPMSLNPHSKLSYEFGEDDILELATLLSENSIHTLVNATQITQCSQLPHDHDHNHNHNHDDDDDDNKIKGAIIRPTKVKKVFAYKSCRSAIMIGKSLTQQEMRDVIDNIPKLDQPWNCPHGRPTMRHLFDLSLLIKHFKDKGQLSEFGPFAFA